MSEIEQRHGKKPYRSNIEREFERRAEARVQKLVEAQVEERLEKLVQERARQEVAQSLTVILEEKFGTVDEQIAESIRKIEDIQRLRDLQRGFLKANSLEEVFALINS